MLAHDCRVMALGKITEKGRDQVIASRQKDESKHSKQEWGQPTAYPEKNMVHRKCLFKENWLIKIKFSVEQYYNAQGLQACCSVNIVLF